MNEFHLRAGSTAREPYLVEVGEHTGCRWTSLRVAELPPDSALRFGTGEEEMFVLPLAGSFDVTCDGQRFELRGRPNVFSAATDTVYVPRDAQVEVSSPAGGRFALPAAACSQRLDARHQAAADVPVEIRGTGNATRQVNNFGSADTFEADRLIAVEVITPAGNWSSYPPHKHDEDVPGEEAELEEIYYFELSDPRGFGFHRVYGTPKRPIDVLAEVRDGDVVLVPHGWHGPSAAAPGYDMYYLNVMAGPGRTREWLIRDDPDHAWVRTEWAGQQADPRLPLTTPRPV
ncbi:MAG TPA: 5-deoxy-glucuronate isomerase [Jiangellaceae bacterium]|nr:5-deoxy-glucuronate isomerase [Jiangellaceae bacterium]